MTLSPELQQILDEANSRGSLVDGHEDLKPLSPEVQRPRFVPARPFHTIPLAKPDPRSMGPQPQPLKSGYDSPVANEEWLKLWHR